MNDNSAYIVQCTCENFDDAKYLTQMFCRVLDICDKSYTIKTTALDATLKRRLDEIGASFWPQPDYLVARPSSG